MPPTNNQILNTDIKNSGIDGIHVFAGSGNSFINNQVDTSGGHGAEDDTVGTGTSNTANTWKDNDCKNSGTATSSPPGLCEGD